MDTIKITDKVLLARSRPHRLAWLIAAPFFVAAGYLLYVLADSLVSYIMAASFSEWLAAIPGMLFILVLALAILFPGLYIAATDSIVVNQELGVIGKRRELLGLHTPGKTIKLEDIKEIICRQKTRKHTRKKPGETAGVTGSVTWFIVDLTLTDDREANLLEYTDKNDAKALAKALSKFTGIALDDRVR